MAIKVMIVDDHNLVREGLKAVFSQGDEIEVVGEAGSGEQAIEMVDQVKPDGHKHAGDERDPGHQGDPRQAPRC
jgi:DNA-binding LytR/AlgR family response regulator